MLLRAIERVCSSAKLEHLTRIAISSMRRKHRQISCDAALPGAVWVSGSNKNGHPLSRRAARSSSVESQHTDKKWRVTRCAAAMNEVETSLLRSCKCL